MPISSTKPSSVVRLPEKNNMVPAQERLARTRNLLIQDRNLIVALEDMLEATQTSREDEENALVKAFIEAEIMANTHAAMLVDLIEELDEMDDFGEPQ